MSRYELTPIDEWAKHLAKQAGSAVYGLTENALVLVACIIAPAIYLGAIVYFAVEKRVSK